MSKNKTAQIATKAIELDEEQRLVHIIATTESLDRDLESISTKDILVPVRPSGLKYAYELTGMERTKVKVLLDHDWAIKSQAGIVNSAKMNANGELEMWLRLSKNVNGQYLYDLIKEDMTDNSWSIGYSLQNATLENGQIKNIELLEVSGVATASNRDAETLDWKSIKEEKSMTELDKKKAQLKALEDEIAEAEKTEEVEEAEVVESETTETTEEVVVEEKTETEEVAEVTDDEEVEETEEEVTETLEETKSVKKETKMSEKTAAIKTIDAASQEVIEAPATKKIDKYDFAAKQFVAFVNKDTKTLKELNEQAIASYSEASGSKATYLNTGVMADGGAIVPEAQLLADVYTLLEEWSTVASDLRVITLTEGNSLNIASLIQDVIVAEVTTEGGTKPVTKPVFGEDELALREFAGIAILTKKLVRQAAVNVFDILRDSFARAIARQRAELALTDATSGITNQTGTGVIQVAAVNGIATYAEIRQAPYQIPAGAVRGAKYYISREQLAALDGEVNPVTGLSTDVVRLDGDGLSGTFANGFRFAVEEELGQGGVPHVVFGSMSRFGILLRQGTVEAETFDTGIVVDGSSVSHNLLQQNKLAHRVAFYENVGYPLPAAFAVSEVNNS